MTFLTVESFPCELRNAIFKRQLVAGERLFRWGDLVRGFYIVETGRIKLTRPTIEDKMAFLQFVKPGESLGEEAIFSDFYSCTAIAEVVSQVIVYPRQLLLLAIRQNPDLAEELMRMLIREIDSFKVSLELWNIKKADRRLLKYLRYLAEPNNGKLVNLDRPLKELSTELRFTPETMSRALARLEGQGQITRHQNSIALNNSPTNSY